MGLDHGQNQDEAEGGPVSDLDGELSFARFLDEIQATLHDLGIPGLFSSRKDIQHLEGLYESGAELDIVIRGIERGFRQKVKKGRDVRGVGELLPTIRAELRRSEPGSL